MSREADLRHEIRRLREEVRYLSRGKKRLVVDEPPPMPHGSLPGLNVTVEGLKEAWQSVQNENYHLRLEGKELRARVRTTKLGGVKEKQKALSKLQDEANDLKRQNTALRQRLRELNEKVKRLQGGPDAKREERIAFNRGKWEGWQAGLASATQQGSGLQNLLMSLVSAALEVTDLPSKVRKRVYLAASSISVPSTTVPRNPGYILTTAQRADIIQRVGEGEPQADLARDYGVSPSAVCALIKRHREGKSLGASGVSARTNARETRDIVEAYANGERLKDISRRFRHGLDMIRKILQGAGVQIKHGGSQPKPFSRAEKTRIIELRRRGLGYQTIGRKIGRAACRVREICEAAGLGAYSVSPRGRRRSYADTPRA